MTLPVVVTWTRIGFCLNKILLLGRFLMLGSISHAKSDNVGNVNDDVDDEDEDDELG